MIIGVCVDFLENRSVALAFLLDIGNLADLCLV